MAALIRKKPIEVGNRLAELGWTREQLIEAVDAMVSARNDTTENDPSSAPGWMAWKDGIRRLRELALPMGWQRDETNNVPSVINIEAGLKLTVCNTDDGTCLEIGGRIPQNRTKKGPAMDRTIANNTGWLFSPSQTPRVVPFSKAGKQPGVITTFYLCVYHEGEEVRAELSCPVEAQFGYFTDFVERVFLISSGDEYRGIKVEPDKSNKNDESDFDIPVSRKK
jgi:hypothetical protein